MSEDSHQESYVTSFNSEMEKLRLQRASERLQTELLLSPGPGRDVIGCNIKLQVFPGMDRLIIRIKGYDLSE